MSPLDLLSLAFVGYGLLSMLRGTVRVRGGLFGQTVDREESPVTFWLYCIIYVVMGAMMTWAVHRH